MSLSVIVGLQWGDEGKGKITDLLSKKSDYIIRYQGGNNAGHSLKIKNEIFTLHLIPSGVIHTGKKCIIGPGVVVDPSSLIDELKILNYRGIDTKKIYLSQRSHITMPYHSLLDTYQEEFLGKNLIGTTKKGIGPTYEDQTSRIGIRFIDLMNKNIFYKKLKNNIYFKNNLFKKIYGKKGMNFEKIYKKYIYYANKLRPRIIDSVYIIQNAIQNGKNILFEGAQATLLDIMYGTYPYVTTSYPSAGGVCIGTGVPPNTLKKIIGVAKAYSTRVGCGPFPTELKNKIGELIRRKGNEYGSTTSRPRRCGWIDLVALKYSCMINGINYLILTKIDVLSGLQKIRVNIGYKNNKGKKIEYFPCSVELLEKVKPIYINLPGWEEDLSKINNYKYLPINCKKYIHFIENFIKKNINIISVGPDRKQNIFKKN
jgi:adenylosuccinate synthase